MTPTILVIGGTGNTGTGLLDTLPRLLSSKSAFTGHRLLLLTRQSNSASAKRLAGISGITVEEKDWVEITEGWLLERNVVRLFVAAHNDPSQFADEGQLLTNALQAGVKYVVRISTTSSNVVSNSPCYYPRSHWAIETMLSQPEFEPMLWTSLRPNIFHGFVLLPVANFIRHVKQTGQQDTLRILLDETTPTGLIDPFDVGVFAAHLLSQDNPEPHNRQKYVLNGPKNVTGRQIVEMVEQEIDAKVQRVSYKDTILIEERAATSDRKNLILSIKHAPVTSWNGQNKAETTSTAVLELAPPQGTARDSLLKLLSVSQESTS